jgi:ABC-type sugar transport system permease subunit
MKIKKLFKKYIWKKDKLYHLIVGTLIYIIIALLFSPAVGLILALLAGFSKEIYDQFLRTKMVDGVKVKTNNGEGLDFFATIFLPVILFLISTL